MLKIHKERGIEGMSVETNWKGFEQKFTAAVKLAKRPVAVAFLEAAPAGVHKFEGMQPFGCSFWRLAASGKVFYTVLCTK